MSATGQQGISYTYDNADRLTAITQGTDSVGIAYDNANLRTSLTLPNGVSLAYTYDGASELTGLTWTKSGASLAEITYAYDNAGRMNQMARSLGGGNLPGAVSSTTYNAANQLTQWDAATLSYDLNGNLLSDGASSYTWNARNQLAAMGPMTFQYDALGRRIRNAQGTSFLYDRSSPIQELAGFTVTANLLTGFGIDEIFTRTDTTASHSLLRDRLGSTVALTDASGTLRTQYTYEPFGQTTVSGQANSNPYQFTGRENDGTGLYDYRTRYYNATLGRFISEDPIGFLGGQANLYSYVGDDPINYIDPFGLDKKKDFQQCMGQHATDFSIVGTVNYMSNSVFGRNDNYKDSVAGGIIGGNAITSLLWGGLSDQAGAPAGVIGPAMGTATSYGRRTSTLMSLNLEGKGGLPLALGGSPAVKSALNMLSLGLSLMDKFLLDAAFTVGEAAYCLGSQ